MSIKRETPNSAIDDYIEELAERRMQAIIRNLCYVGEQCVNEARSYNGNQYTDQTGNLRSSTGYVVVSDGNIVQVGNFQQIKSGSEGTKAGQAFARQIASQFSKGICLIVVAGMKYATYVSAKGYNVLDSSELLAEKLVPQMLEQLGIEFK
jgi:hypothetical protein